QGYVIKEGEAGEGIAGGREGSVCIDYRDADEYAISRPCVVRDGTTYRMWFSSRGGSYRIEHAVSDDGLRWTRLGAVEGIESTGEWDAEMQAYPAVLDHGGTRDLLYNGNGYGATGVCWAAWIASA